jgi:hypothetical protein
LRSATCNWGPALHLSHMFERPDLSYKLLQSSTSTIAVCGSLDHLHQKQVEVPVIFARKNCGLKAKCPLHCIQSGSVYFSTITAKSIVLSMCRPIIVGRLTLRYLSGRACTYSILLLYYVNSTVNDTLSKIPQYIVK